MAQVQQELAGRQLSYILLAFSVLFLVTALVLDSDSGPSKRAMLPPGGGIVGPVHIAKPGTVVEIEVSQSLSRNRVWSFITGELLDANKEYLTGFGDELYYEEGRDSDGRWVESNRGYKTKLTIKKSGDYYFKFTTESNAATTNLPSMYVNIGRKMASSIPHFAGGIVLLIIGVVLNLKNGGILTRLLDND